MDKKKKDEQLTDQQGENPQVDEEVEIEEVKEVPNKLNEELEQAKKEALEYKNSYLRALADYQNLENRMQKERVEIIKSATANVLDRFFPVIDNLNQAEVFIKDPGLKMVKDNFMSVLQELGVKEIELLGKEYDPYTAEVIEVVDGEKDNIVIEVLTQGYELNGKVLRPGKVRVSRKSE